LSWIELCQETVVTFDHGVAPFIGQAVVDVFWGWLKNPLKEAVGIGWPL
jgi:hypothetical protein